MITNAQTLIQSLSGALRRLSVTRIAVDTFKTQFLLLLDSINDKETEEFHKNLVSKFLQETYYNLKDKPKNFINTKGQNDLVIHNGETAKTSVGVIIEAKKPTNSAEMPTLQNVNVKAFHELILYYLRERISHKNLEIKHLAITNVYEWFIFDVQEIDRLFAQNKTFVQQYQDFLEGRLADNRTDFFYKQIAEPFIKNLDAELNFTHFSLKDYETFARNNTPEDDKKLLELYKIFSPEHLLKLPFVNDSNTLDKGFYFELLHIMGLKEVQEGGKKLIQRNPEKERNTGSILEETILRIESLQKLDRLPNLETFGNTREEQLFGVGLELTITWINRILFLKLLEAQLLSYHKGDKHYAFLSAEKFRCASGLDVLFFDILAKEPASRHPDTKLQYEKIPYLNSSLFEITELEHQTVLIGNLHTDKILPLYSQTVLKNRKGQKQTENLRMLDYLFAFLEAYDFGAEGKGDIQEENKPLITASVLGLVFEKINGYQDGSFFTPGFITMYMCKETLQRAVVQKFNEVKKWNCKSIEDLYEKIDDKKEANQIMNSLKICDPAVGSGHFLVSVLNEMIAIKSELRILLDRKGLRLKEYKAIVENDELMIFDIDDNEYFKYRPHHEEKLRVQEAIFHEKQTIIENCLFGVDINPNSVKICRLRLWIELLKNAYYTEESKYKKLETLPNIDINIKCGNSLISKLQLNDSLNQFNNAQRQTIRRLMPDYKKQVSIYKGVRDREVKRKTVALLEGYRQTFLKMFNPNDADYLDYKALENKWVNAQLSLHQTAESLEKLQSEFEIAKEKWEAKTKIYRNAFEWRFEFPEVLDEEGNFVGFDVVVGNPPWGVGLTTDQKNYLKTNFPEIDSSTPNTYAYFIGLSYKIGIIFSSQVLPDSILVKDYAKTRLMCAIDLYNLAWYQNSAMPNDLRPFVEVEHDVCAILLDRRQKTNLVTIFTRQYQNSELYQKTAVLEKSNFILAEYDNIYNISLSEGDSTLLKKLQTFDILENYLQCHEGVHSGNIREKLFLKHQITGQEKPMFVGGKSGDTIEKYLSYRAGWFVDYREAVIDKTKKEYASLRDEQIFSQPKIYVARTGNPLKAFIDKNNYASNNFFSIQFKDYALNDYYALLPILGLLNSKLANYYIRKIVAPSLGNTFVETKIIHILQIPMTAKLLISNFLIDAIKELLSLKTDNPNADTSILETEIDNLVYKLYDLTAEEINIVESGTR
jgi:adenine-specific DNA-methyltransferase